MTSGDPEVIARSVDSTHAWLRDLCDELGSDDRRYAYRVLRSVLHVLRDRLPVDESAQLAAQLPELVRGVYYEGWRPSATPQELPRTRAASSTVSRQPRCSTARPRRRSPPKPSPGWLRRRVSAGEIADVLAVLRAEVRKQFAGRRTSVPRARRRGPQLLPACQRRAEGCRCASSVWDAATGC